MTRLLLAMLLCAACKHSTSSSSTSHSETSTVTDSTSSETGTQTTVTTTSEAPGHTHTVIDEFAPPEPEKEEPGSSDGSEARPQGVRLEPPASQNAGLPRKVPRRGPLVKRTTIDSDTGEKTAKTAQEASTQAQGATETKAAAKGDTTAKGKDEGGPSAGCIGSSWLIGIGAILFAVALILGVLRFRKG